MVGWHHQLDGHESEQTQEDSDGQRSMSCDGVTKSQHDLATEQQQQ